MTIYITVSKDKENKTTVSTFIRDVKSYTYNAENNMIHIVTDFEELYLKLENLLEMEVIKDGSNVKNDPSTFPIFYR